MTTASEHDYRRLCREHLADFRAFLHDLPDERWDEPSLCRGWAARDVVGHLTIGRTLAVPTVLWRIARSGFRVDAVIDRESRAFAARHTPAELRAAFDEETSRPRERGLAGIEPPKAKLADNVTHLYDIAMPLGLDPALPAARLVAVLEALPRVGMWGSKQRARGLRLIAEDVGWQRGDGPEVRGPAPALVLALGGRRQALDQLTGDGVGVLGDRLTA